MAQQCLRERWITLDKRRDLVQRVVSAPEDWEHRLRRERGLTDDYGPTTYHHFEKGERVRRVLVWRVLIAQQGYTGGEVVTNLAPKSFTFVGTIPLRGCRDRGRDGKRSCTRGARALAFARDAARATGGGVSTPSEGRSRSTQLVS